MAEGDESYDEMMRVQLLMYRIGAFLYVGICRLISFVRRMKLDGVGRLGTNFAPELAMIVPFGRKGLPLFTAICALAMNASAAVYYVDGNNASANDSNSGIASAPWKTISKANSTLVAGGTVFI